MIQEAIAKLVDRNDLTREESREVFVAIMSGQATDAQIGSLITALRMKGETVEEITGAVQAMQKACTKISHPQKSDLLDIVGTGGDMKNSFNVSTAAAIVAAG